MNTDHVVEYLVKGGNVFIEPFSQWLPVEDCMWLSRHSVYPDVAMFRWYQNVLAVNGREEN